MLASPELANCLDNMLIDSHQLYTLTKFTTTKGMPSVKRTDHFTMIANFSVDWSENKPPREEVFKLRDKIGLEKFNQITSTSPNLLKCFQKDTVPLGEACQSWYKAVEKIFHQCFKKIRISHVPPKHTVDYEIHKLLLDIQEIKRLSASAAMMCKPPLEAQLKTCEMNVAKVQGEKCRKIIEAHAMGLQTNNTLNSNAAWNLKKKLFPKACYPPFAVFDKNGQLVTNSKEILRVMKEEFVFRLRNREINKEFLELKELKEYLCRLRLEITKKADYTPWTLPDLEKAISKLKNNKCKDPHGHINELYKHMGANGLQSLLAMLNRIKLELIVPAQLQISNVTTIYKGT
jgi:hypothetical protein